MVQDWKTVKKFFFHKYQLYGIDGYSLIWFLYYQGVYKLQILHKASLVRQDKKKINVMGVQMTYIIIQDRKSVKRIFPKMLLWHWRLYSYFDFFYVKGLRSPDFAYS